MRDDSDGFTSATYLWWDPCDWARLGLVGRIGMLPIYILGLVYHCLRGTPVRVQYGRRDDPADEDTRSQSWHDLPDGMKDDDNMGVR